MMGSSEYEFEPDKFDEDVQKHIKEYRDKRESIYNKLETLIKIDYKHRENFNLIIENMIKLRKKYKID